MNWTRTVFYWILCHGIWNQKALGLNLGFTLAHHVSLGKLTSLEFDFLIYMIIIVGQFYTVVVPTEWHSASSCIVYTRKMCLNPLACLKDLLSFKWFTFYVLIKQKKREISQFVCFLKSYVENVGHELGLEKWACLSRWEQEQRYRGRTHMCVRKSQYEEK